MTEHHTEIGSDHQARLASASCSCGWSTVKGFARPTGEPVALWLVAIHAERHEQGLDEIGADAPPPGSRYP